MDNKTSDLEKIITKLNAENNSLRSSLANAETIIEDLLFEINSIKSCGAVTRATGFVKHVLGIQSYQIHEGCGVKL